jgi:hypothetical protein
MSRLNENHKRRLLSAFQHMDKLLSQSLNAVAAAPPCLHALYIQDMSPSELRYVQSNIEKIREQTSGLLEKFQVALPPPSTPLSWILKTNLTSLDIVFEDLYPKKMRGYGDMDQSTAKDLTAEIEKMRKHLNQLLAFLADANNPK